MEDSPNSVIDDIRVGPKGEKLNVYIRAFSNTEFTPIQRTNYLNRLAGKLERKPSSIELRIDIISIAEREKAATVVQATPTPATIAQLKANYIQRYRDALTGLKLTEPAEFIDFEDTTDSSGQSSLRIYYLSIRDIETDGKAALENTVRSLLNLPTITLFFTRVSSDATKIPFEVGSVEFDKQSDEIISLVRNFRNHKTIKARIMLSESSTDEELLGKRKAALSDYLFKEMGLDAKRVVFTESDDPEDGNTYQLFIK